MKTVADAFKSLFRDFYKGFTKLPMSLRVACVTTYILALACFLKTSVSVLISALCLTGFVGGMFLVVGVLGTEDDVINVIHKAEEDYNELWEKMSAVIDAQDEYIQVLEEQNDKWSAFHKDMAKIIDGMSKTLNGNTNEEEEHG